MLVRAVVSSETLKHTHQFDARVLVVIVPNRVVSQRVVIVLHRVVLDVPYG